MPGPVSDSYDPEFGTGAGAAIVVQGIKQALEPIDKKLGPGLKDIVEVACSVDGRLIRMGFSERELRLIRFACRRALETI